MKKLLALTLTCMTILSMAACSAGDRIQLGKGNSDSSATSKYKSGDATITETIDALDIDWAAGKVDLVLSDEMSITIHEECKKELNDKQKVQWFVDGSTLKISFCAPHAGTNIPEKDLTVTVPKDIVLKSLDIDNASSIINIAPIAAEQVKIDTASGDITAAFVGSCKNADIDSASGESNITFDQLDDLTMDTASGNINITAEKLSNSLKCDSASGDITASIGGNPASMKIGTASGEVNLILDDKLGFTATVDTASGKFNSSLPINISDGKYTHADGSCKINIDTASGDITINER